MNERPQTVSGRLDEEADGRKLTYGEEARLSGKDPMTEKAKFIIKKINGKTISVATDNRPGPVLQDAVVTSDLLGGKIASYGIHAPAGSDQVATPDFELKSKAMRRAEYSMQGTLTRKDGYNQIAKGILTGNILKKPGLPKIGKL